AAPAVHPIGACRTRPSQERRVDLNSGASADGGATSLELVDRKIDPRDKEGMEGALDAVRRNEPLDVPVFASGEAEEAMVGVGLTRHGPLDGGQEIRLTVLPALAEDLLGLDEGQRMAQEVG